MKANKTIFLTKDGRVAKTSDEAAFLLVRKGQEIPIGLVQKYNLNEKPKPAPSENKILKPSATKESAPPVKKATPKKRGRKPAKLTDA